MNSIYAIDIITVKNPFLLSRKVSVVNIKKIEFIVPICL